MSNNTPEEVMTTEEVIAEAPEAEAIATEETGTKKKGLFGRKKKAKKTAPILAVKR